MKKSLVVVVAGMIFITVIAVTVIVFFSSDRSSSNKGKTFNVVATFYPLGALAQEALGSRGRVAVIVPSGVEPHEYEPTPKDIIASYEADIFLMNGAGMDPWAEDLRAELELRGTTVVVMAEHADLMKHEHESPEDNESERYDPHFWLDPKVAQEFIGAIEPALSEKDPMHAEQYQRSANVAKKKLSDIDVAYRKTLSSCAKRTIVVSHDAYGYLARRYGFETLSLSGLSPESEPSAKRMAELAEFVKKENVRYIFLETLASPKVAETIARETGVKTLVFDPIEGISSKRLAEGEDYFSIMESNLENLAVAMECKK